MKVEIHKSYQKVEKRLLKNVCTFSSQGLNKCISIETSTFASLVGQNKVSNMSHLSYLYYSGLSNMGGIRGPLPPHQGLSPPSPNFLE